MIRWFWKRLPDGLQLRILSFPLVAAWRTAMSRRRWQGLEFNRIYDKAYFDFVEKTTGPAAAVISDSICTDCRPTYALDVGCGTGVLLAALRDRGVKVVGLELAEAARTACEGRGIEVYAFDASIDAPPAFVRRRSGDQHGGGTCDSGKSIGPLCRSARIVPARGHRFFGGSSRGRRSPGAERKTAEMVDRPVQGPRLSDR